MLSRPEFFESEPIPSPEPVGQLEPSKNGAIVVKIGGSTLGSHDTTLEDLIALQREGIQPIVIHGGGKVITDWMEKQGVRARFVKGLRVTDEASLDIVVAVLTGLINKQLVSAILSLGGKTVGMSGVDGGILQGEILDPELGYVGKVTQVNPEPIQAVVDAGFMPVIAPVAVRLGGDGTTLLNVNADTAAGEIAATLGVKKLVFMTDVEGVLDSSRRLIPRITERQAKSLMSSNVIAGGMIPKIGACLQNVGQGRMTHIIDGRKPHALRSIVEGETLGTRVG
jgi:acetylglutamate kinase